MKLSSNASVLRITYEGITNFQSFMDFDRDSIISLSKVYRKDIDIIIADVPNVIVSENVVPGRNISMIPICRLVVATNDVKYYTAIGWTPNFENMHYVNVHREFKTYYDAYVRLKRQISPQVSLVSDKDR